MSLHETTGNASAQAGMYRITDPSSGQTVRQYANTAPDEISAALQRADEAYRAGLRIGVAERTPLLSRAAALLRERAEELATIIAQEMGKPLPSGLGEVEFCAAIFDYYATNGERFAADQPIPAETGSGATIQRRPLGVLLGIMPWNYPYYQVARFAAPNLALGNTLILKPAEACPRSAIALQELLMDAGFARGAYQTVFASHGDVATIIQDPRVRGVSLTGSERAGAEVASIAGRNLKKVVLELGGSDPYVILDTDDVAQAAATAWAMRMENVGQACNSNKRIIVAEGIYREFVAEMTSLAANLEPGDPLTLEDNQYPPMASRAGAENLREQLVDAVSKGATLHAGGTLPHRASAHFAPTVLTGVTEEMRAYREELFGPVAVVYSARNEEEASRLANDSEYGLGAAVFSEHPERARAFAAGLECGMVAINAPAAEGAELPFGGVKRSGYGRELGPLGMDEFVNKRLVYNG